MVIPRAVIDEAWDSVLEEGLPSPTVWAEAAAPAEAAAARSLEGRRRPRSLEPAEVPERASTGAEAEAASEGTSRRSSSSASWLG